MTQSVGPLVVGVTLLASQVLTLTRSAAKS